MANATSIPTFEQIVEALAEAKNGTNIKLAWERPLATYKKLGDMNITKRVEMVGRKGITFEQMKLIQERNAEWEAEGRTPTREPWFYHNENDVKGIIRHKKTDVPYIQLFDGTDSRHIPKVTYFQDGEEIEWEDIKDCVTSKDQPKPKGKYDITFTCKLENMLTIKRTLVEVEVVELEVEQRTSDNEQSESQTQSA